MTSSRDIRKSFLDFFAERGHRVVPSGPILLAADPTLMFANAGMVQFKDVFTGKEKRDYRRATSSQKCVRVSGKHNDLENVGVTARHHTFFEMLGNFSFGDYFKEDAIKFAWDFVSRLGFDRNRMVVSVFRGEGSLPADDEAARMWADVSGLPPERILRLGVEDNFWSMGDTGPCGPCSEIYYCFGDSPDLGSFGAEPTPDGRGWVEIWNLVFMQFERHADGRLEPLPAPSIDTGAGLERTSCIVQGVLSNYDTDVLRPLVDLAGDIARKRYTGGAGPDDVSMRVVADHARTTAFLITEGVFPDKEGKSYVLRRVMRRAIRHGHRLGIEEPFLHTVAGRVVDLMGGVYPELVERGALITDIAKDEEVRFRQTLKRGLEMLDTNEEWRTEGERRVLPGSIAFKLYDTFGFPVDLQEVIGREQGFDVDAAGFGQELERQREKSRGSKIDARVIEQVYRVVREEVGDVRFVGYETESAKSTIAALVRGGEVVRRLGAGEEGEVVTRETPFYGEQGGQVGDRGVIRAGDALFEVTDSQKPVEGLVVHRGVLRSGTLETGREVELAVDHDARSATRRNHSATHLLHWALREVVGPHAVQKGSLVGPDRLRFDYSGTRALAPEEVRRIEDLVNRAVLENSAVTTEVLPMGDAKKRGAIGIFEEKYGETVRMLRIGSSLELCGGTHAFRTGDIGAFKVLSDGALQAGVRRIEAATGLHTVDYLREVEQQLEGAAELLRAPPSQTRERIERLLAEQRELGKEIERLKKQLMTGGSKDLAADARDADGFKVLGTTVELGDPKSLRELAEQLRDKLAPAVVLLGTQAADGKALLACSVSGSITGLVQAGNVVKDAAKIVGGGGGGRPDFAQAGGPDASKLPEAVSVVYRYAKP